MNIETVDDFPKRSLTPGERTMIREVFGNEIKKLDQVIVFNRPHWTPIYLVTDEKRYFGAHALGRRIFFPSAHKKNKQNNYYAQDFSSKSEPLWRRATFMHEMTHVWQSEAGRTKYNDKSQKTLAAMNETDPLISRSSLREVTANEIFEVAAKQAMAALNGKTYIKPWPTGDLVRASEHHSKGMTLTAKELRQHWKEAIDYNYLMPSETLDCFYDLSRDQQAEMVEDYYTLNELDNQPYCPGPQRDLGISWRELPPLSFYQAFIPFLPKTH